MALSTIYNYLVEIGTGTVEYFATKDAIYTFDAVARRYYGWILGIPSVRSAANDPTGGSPDIDDLSVTFANIDNSLTPWISVDGSDVRKKEIKVWKLDVADESRKQIFHGEVKSASISYSEDGSSTVTLSCTCDSTESLQTQIPKILVEPDTFVDNDDYGLIAGAELYRGEEIVISTTSASSPVIVVTAVEHKLYPGQTIKISGVYGGEAAIKLNREWQIGSAGSTSFTIVEPVTGTPSTSDAMGYGGLVTTDPKDSLMSTESVGQTIPVVFGATREHVPLTLIRMDPLGRAHQPSPSSSPSPSVSPSRSFSPSPSRSVSPSRSFSPSPSRSVSPTPSPSASPSVSPSDVRTPPHSFSPSASPSYSRSASPSRSPSFSRSASPSLSHTPSPSTSRSISPSASVSRSPSASISASLSPGVSTDTRFDEPAYVYVAAHDAKEFFCRVSVNTVYVAGVTAKLQLLPRTAYSVMYSHQPSWIRDKRCELDDLTTWHHYVAVRFPWAQAGPLSADLEATEFDSYFLDTGGINRTTAHLLFRESLRDEITNNSLVSANASAIWTFNQSINDQSGQGRNLTSSGSVGSHYFPEPDERGYSIKNTLGNAISLSVESDSTFLDVEKNVSWNVKFRICSNPTSEGVGSSMGGYVAGKFMESSMPGIVFKGEWHLQVSNRKPVFTVVTLGADATYKSHIITGRTDVLNGVFHEIACEIDRSKDKSYMRLWINGEMQEEKEIPNFDAVSDGHFTIAPFSYQGKAFIGRIGLTTVEYFPVESLVQYCLGHSQNSQSAMRIGPSRVVINDYFYLLESDLNDNMNGALTSENFFLMAWVAREVAPTSEVTLVEKMTGTPTGYRITMNASETIKVYINNNSVATLSYTPSTTLVDAKFHQIWFAFNANESKVRLYVDAVLVDEENWSAAFTGNGAKFNLKWDAYVDELVIVKGPKATTVITSDNIRTQYMNAIGNPVRLIRNILESTSWGLGKTTNSITFNAAEDEIWRVRKLKYGGSLNTQRPASDVLDECMRGFGMYLKKHGTSWDIFFNWQYPVIITTTSGGNGSSVVVNTADDHQITVGQTIVISGTSVSALNTTWEVASVTATSLTLANSTGAPLATGSGGYLGWIAKVGFLDGRFNNLTTVSEYAKRSTDDIPKMLSVRYKKNNDPQKKIAYLHQTVPDENIVNETYGGEDVKYIELPFVRQWEVAARIAYFLREWYKADRILNVSAGRDVGDISVGDIVNVTIPALSISTENFRVKSASHEGDNVTLELYEDAPLALTFDDTGMIRIPDNLVPDSVPDYRYTQPYPPANFQLLCNMAMSTGTRVMVQFVMPSDEIAQDIVIAYRLYWQYDNGTTTLTDAQMSPWDWKCEQIYARPGETCRWSATFDTNRFVNIYVEAVTRYDVSSGKAHLADPVVPQEQVVVYQEYPIGLVYKDFEPIIVWLSEPHELEPNDSVTISGASQSYLNQEWIVQEVLSNTHFTLKDSVKLSSNSSGGTVTGGDPYYHVPYARYINPIISETILQDDLPGDEYLRILTGDVGTVTFSIGLVYKDFAPIIIQLTKPHGFIVGDLVTIEGASQTYLNAQWEVGTVPAANTFTLKDSVALPENSTGGTVTKVITSISGNQGNQESLAAGSSSNKNTFGHEQRIVALENSTVAASVGVRIREIDNSYFDGHSIAFDETHGNFPEEPDLVNNQAFILLSNELLTRSDVSPPPAGKFYLWGDNNLGIIYYRAPLPGEAAVGMYVKKV